MQKIDFAIHHCQNTLCTLMQLIQKWHQNGDQTKANLEQLNDWPPRAGSGWRSFERYQSIVTANTAAEPGGTEEARKP